jgi:hypothetical protein
MAYAPTYTAGGFGGYPAAGFGQVAQGFGGYPATAGFGGYPATAGFGGYPAATFTGASAFGGYPTAGFAQQYMGEVHNPVVVPQQVVGEQVVGYGTQLVEQVTPVVTYQRQLVEQPIVYEQPMVYEVPQVVDIVEPIVQPVYMPPPPPPRQRVSIVARSRDPRAQAAANELLNRFRGVAVGHPGDVQRLLDNSARTLSRALPNPVVA